MPHEISRVRHELKQRTLNVSYVERITPKMIRITFVSDDLRDFVSVGADDHVKLFVPASGSRGAMRLEKRDYTVRRFDRSCRELVIDFVVHDAGPATRWALAAKAGDTLTAGGPRGSQVVEDDFDWYVLVGDETALPAIGRRVEELRPGVPVVTLVAITDRAEEQVFETRADLRSVWVHRPSKAVADPASLLSALAAVEFPAGDGFVWIAGEASVVRALRAHVVDERGHPKDWTKATGYWKMTPAEQRRGFDIARYARAFRKFLTGDKALNA